MTLEKQFKVKRPPRAFYFSIIAIFIGITQREETQRLLGSFICASFTSHCS